MEPEEASIAKRARPLPPSDAAAAGTAGVPLVEVTAPEVSLPASLANHEFLVGSIKPNQETNQVWNFNL